MASWVIIRLEGSDPAMTYGAWGAPKTYATDTSASYRVPHRFTYEGIEQATYGVRRAS